MEFNKALQKQIEKFLPDNYKSDDALLPFLESVNKLYLTYERDKKISEHAFEISEKEYQLVLQNLKKQDEINVRSIERIKSLIISMDKNLNSEYSQNYDLQTVISFLEETVDKAKQLEELLMFAKVQAENNVKAKSNFLSVMSHEIRTPLNAIIGSIHLLKQEYILPEQKEYIESLNISAENLLNLINDVLDYNKIEEGKIEFAKNDVNISKLLQNIRLANFFKSEESNNKLILNIDKNIPKYILTDETRLSQILNNLISNAIKFTQQGIVSIDVNLIKSNINDCTLAFKISDTGIGIESSKLNNIFERFTQADSNINRKFGGSGLGLTIVKKLLELQNSEIQVESELGKGSCFHFNLNVGISSKTIENEEFKPSEKKDLNNIKILLVEDNKINITIAKKMLTNWNAQVEVAENGEIAIEKFNAYSCNLILMDLHMPVMDGIEATKIIRKIHETIPILALTASSLLEVKDNIFEAGMNGFISKPFNPEELYSTIRMNL